MREEHFGQREQPMPRLQFKVVLAMFVLRKTKECPETGRRVKEMRWESKWGPGEEFWRAIRVGDCQDFSFFSK